MHKYPKAKLRVPQAWAYNIFLQAFSNFEIMVTFLPLIIKVLPTHCENNR